VASEASSACPSLEKRRCAVHNYGFKVEARKQEGLSRGAYLWIDELPTWRSENRALKQNLKQGGVEMRRLGKGEARGAGGMIHDWDGMVLYSRA